MFLKHLRAKFIVLSVTLICASTLFGGVQANAECLLPDGDAGKNIPYHYATAYINSLIYADIALNQAENEIAARDFECAASAIGAYEQFPIDHSSLDAEKQSELARKTATAARENYLAFANIVRRIATIGTGELDLRGQATLSADIQDRSTRLFVFSASVLKILVDPKPDSLGRSNRLSITADERDDLVRMIDQSFGNQARKTLWFNRSPVLSLRLWLTTSGYTPRTPIEDREPMSQETTHPRNKPETNYSHLALGFIIFFFIGRAIYKHPTRAFLMGRIIYNVLPKRCLHCNTRTRNNNRICDACKTRMDYEKAKAQEREQQEREARNREKKREEASAEENRKRDEDARRGKSTWNEAGTHSTGGEGFNPYEVLQVNRSASKEEIKEAYLKVIKQYHPDKVSHLGKEFQDIANEKTQAINRAYEILTSL